MERLLHFLILLLTTLSWAGCARPLEPAVAPENPVLENPNKTASGPPGTRINVPLMRPIEGEPEAFTIVAPDILFAYQRSPMAAEAFAS